MKRFIAIVAFFTLVLASTVIVVNAHPGRTDGNGGHTDNSTGEYHYHHGYPAHDHYDMDEDGDLDCPYEFDDKTDNDNGNNNGIASNYSTNEYDNSKGIASNNFTSDRETKNAVPQRKGTSVIPKTLICIFVAAASIPVSFFLCSFTNPISLIVEWLSERSGGTDKAYRFWTGLFIIVVQIFLVYKVITL